MRCVCLAVAVLAASDLSAQRRVRIGPVVSSIAIDDASGAAQSFTAFGGTLAFLTREDGEIGLSVARYDDLSADACERALTLFGLESNYYPVGAGGLAPFASSSIGLARVTESQPRFGCGLLPTTTTSTEIGLGFGLGVRVNVGTQVAALVEGRFFQIPNSAIQALEGRANVSFAFGKERTGDLRQGTFGPAVGLLLTAGGPLEGRAPTIGVRFRRDTKKSSVLGLQIDYAPLRIGEGCSSQCEPAAVLFAPSYEPSLRPAWGRLYASLGLLLAGFPSEGPDRGIGQGAHGGVGADIAAGSSLMANVNTRLLWWQRNTGANVFLVQLSASVSRAIESR